MWPAYVGKYPHIGAWSSTPRIIPNFPKFAAGLVANGRQGHSTLEIFSGLVSPQFVCNARASHSYESAKTKNLIYLSGDPTTRGLIPDRWGRTVQLLIWSRKWRPGMRPNSYGECASHYSVGRMVASQRPAEGMVPAT